MYLTEFCQNVQKYGVNRRKKRMNASGTSTLLKMIVVSFLIHAVAIVFLPSVDIFSPKQTSYIEVETVFLGQDGSIEEHSDSQDEQHSEFADLSEQPEGVSPSQINLNPLDPVMIEKTDSIAD